YPADTFDEIREFVSQLFHGALHRVLGGQEAHLTASPVYHWEADGGLVAGVGGSGFGVLE
ncbi:MAG: hypothetical protein O3B42_10075, partial [Actinomycetota bacterium]|nr:hypothetical protein [Actinomycetota bacterium]